MTGFVVGSSVSFVGESWIGAIDPSAELSAKLKCNDVWPLQYNYGAVIGAFDSVGHGRNQFLATDGTDEHGLIIVGACLQAIRDARRPQPCEVACKQAPTKRFARWVG